MKLFLIPAFKKYRYNEKDGFALLLMCLLSELLIKVKACLLYKL
jgi:hypothetical protein